MFSLGFGTDITLFSLELILLFKWPLIIFHCLFLQWVTLAASSKDGMSSNLSGLDCLTFFDYSNSFVCLEVVVCRKTLNTNYLPFILSHYSFCKKIEVNLSKRWSKLDIQVSKAKPHRVYVSAFSIHTAAIMQGARAWALCRTRTRWHKFWDLGSCSD